MQIEIREAGPDELRQYAAIPIAFEVESILRVELLDRGLGGIALREEHLDTPYTKDYDSYEDAGPERWQTRFEIRNWGIFIAVYGGRNVGGAAVAFDIPGVHMLEGRHDLAVLWDLRVAADLRRNNIGTRLFQHAVNWCRARGCTHLKIETQNINVPACRFYAKQGCRLGQIHRYAYVGHPQLKNEVMLIWYLDL